MDATINEEPDVAEVIPDPEDEDLGIAIDLTEFTVRRARHRVDRPSPWRWTFGGLMLAFGCALFGVLVLADDIIDNEPGVEMAVTAWAWASTYIAACGVVLTIADTILDGR